MLLTKYLMHNHLQLYRQLICELKTNHQIQQQNKMCINCVHVNMKRVFLSLSGFPRSGNSQGKMNFFKVREKSGNFEIGQGKLKNKQKSGKSQGIL